jgi:L-seryl-tRNA(Ser) seleniumtransferase
MTLAGLDATLRSYQAGRAVTEIPVWKMISTPFEALQRQATAWQQRLAAERIICQVWPGESTVGGGSLPGETLSTALLAVQTDQPDTIAAELRAADPPVICRIQRDHLLFDPRTVLAEQEETLLQTLQDTVGGR